MIVVRKATSDDIYVIADFQKKMAFETEQLELDSGLVSKGVAAVISDPAKGFYLVAVSANQVAACMLITFEWSDWRNGMYLWIQSLYVSPGFRKQGIFAELYQYVKSLVVKSENYIGLKLYVDVNNTDAQRAYERVGMVSSHYNLYQWSK
jgi:GNAT superfamily N-acetyltransferase